MTDLNAATIGCGRMGAFHSQTVAAHAPAFWMPISHLGAITALDGMTALACCDPSDDHRARAAAQFDVPHAYDSHKALLENHAIDILTIATRTPQKTEIILDALAAGVRAIHVEKPLCNTAQELAQLEQAVTDCGAWMTYGAIRRFLPAYTQALAHAQTPEFGPVTDIHVEMGKAPLMWALVHALDQLIYFAGGAKPVQVQAWFEHLEIDPDQPHTVRNDPKFHAATVLFEGGITGRIGGTGGDAVTISSASARVEVFGDGLQVFASAVPQDGIYQHRQEIPVAAEDRPGGTAAALAQLQGALAGGSTAKASTRAATDAIFASQHLIFDMVQSHLSGGAVVGYRSYARDIAVLGLTGGRPA